MISRSIRSGQLRRNLSGEQAYFSFLPAPLPPNPAIAVDAEMSALLRSIHADIGLLHGMASSISDLPLFLGMCVRKEALFSSQIEGTQATMDDMFDPTIDRNAKPDVAEVMDNVQAVLYAVKQITDPSPSALPLCMRLLRETHKVLLAHCRGRDKEPGEFRHSQNWIGPAGCTLEAACYVPPNVDDMKQALEDLEAFFHRETPELDPVVKAALIHCQFETIHPFLDGNGRIGRLLILLYLMHVNVLSSPLLYISYFLKLRRGEYYELMMAVRRDGAYEEWVRFFLKATSAALSDAIGSIRKLCALHEADRQKVSESTARASVRERRLRFLDYLEHNPIIEIKATAEALGLSFPTASKLVSTFVELGVLQETTGRRRGRTFAYESYLAILRKDAEPL